MQTVTLERAANLPPPPRKRPMSRRWPGSGRGRAHSELPSQRGATLGVGPSRSPTVSSYTRLAVPDLATSPTASHAGPPPPEGWAIVRQHRRRLATVLPAARQRLWLCVSMGSLELLTAPGKLGVHVLPLHALSVAIRRGSLTLRAPGLRLSVDPEDVAVLNEWYAYLAVVTGRRFAEHYRLGVELARGSFAAVHRATHLASGASCAVKVISTTNKRAQSASQLASETRTMSHFGAVPGLMGAREVFHERGAVYIVMDLYRGGSLKELVCNWAPYGVAEQVARGVALKIARALAVMHKDGVAHRDVKLENCLCRDGTFPPRDVVLGDFGFAIFMDETPPTKRSYAVGTPVYVAPEAARAEPHGTEVDVYALGVLVYRMMAAEYPVEGRDDRETLRLMAQSTPVPVHYERTPLREASNECLRFLKACLQWDPRKRITAHAALVHPWLIRAQLEEAHASGLPLPPHLRAPSAAANPARRRWRAAILAIRFVRRLRATAEASYSIHQREYGSWTAEALSDRLKRVSVGKENALAAISSVSKRTSSKIESVIRLRTGSVNKTST